ncbi:MAG: thioredoxin reductase [Maritimibacter sp.]|nr:thioredoxin reductase [Maritimibacter sp.]
MTRSAIVIGAGPSGLATAVCLQKAGFEVAVLERNDRIGSAWHDHYDSLRLHTSRKTSGLPGLPIPASAGKYPSRADMAAYLESYAQTFDLDVRLGYAVDRVDPEDGGWIVRHEHGDDFADVVVFATGLNGQPNRPDWPGLDGFPGPVMHGSEYRNPHRFLDRKVLVVGFGNSGADIATDLAGAGIATGLSVRSPVNIVPLEILGVPVTSLSLLRRALGPAAADRLSAPVIETLVGRPEDYGLRRADKGPVRQVVEDGRVPMIDVGVLAAIKAGRIAVHPGITRFDGGTVHFADDSNATYDTLIAATGYRVDLTAFLPDVPDVLDASGRPKVSGGPSGRRGLYFCSYHASPNGQLRQSAQEAAQIADHAAQTHG